MHKVVKEVDQIQREVYTNLSKRNFDVKDLGSYKISRGMNEKIISEILYYATAFLNARDENGSISINKVPDSVLLNIYKALSERGEETMTPEAKLALKMTLIRYFSIFG
jgi:hypothetical protein